MTRWVKWGAALTVGALLVIVGIRYKQAPSVKPAEGTRFLASPSPFSPAPAIVNESLNALILPEDKNRLQLLKQILDARNDNDPRLDESFRELTVGTKILFRQYYRELAREKRNELGTIVFLLGRKIESVEDLGFFGQVIGEPACLSLSDCGRSAVAGTGEEAHLESGQELTRAYPQVVALKSLERMMSASDHSEELFNSAKQILEDAKKSQDPTVAQMAEKVLKRFTTDPE